MSGFWSACLISVAYCTSLLSSEMPEGHPTGFGVLTLDAAASSGLNADQESFSGIINGMGFSLTNINHISMAGEPTARIGTLFVIPREGRDVRQRAPLISVVLNQHRSNSDQNEITIISGQFFSEKYMIRQVLRSDNVFFCLHERIDSKMILAVVYNKVSGSFAPVSDIETWTDISQSR